MADSSLTLPAAGGVVDTRTTSDSQHRQVVVPGDAATDGVATFTSSGSKLAQDVNLAASGGGTAQASGTLTGSGVSVSAAVGNSGNGTIVVYGGTYTNLPVIFEGSVDGTNWFPIDAARADSSQIVTNTTLPSSAVYAWNYMATGYTNVRIRQTAAATAQSVNPSVIITQGPFLIDPSPTISLLDGQKDTYVTTVNFASNIVGDFYYLRGSTSKLVRLTRLEVGLNITGTITSAGILLSLLKRSAGYTGGTAGATPATIPVDSTQSAATMSAAGTFTAATTGGTLVGTVRVVRFQAAATTYMFTWDFGGGRPSKCPVLRGSSEYLALSLTAAVSGTSPVPNWSIVAETTEEG